MSLDLNQFILSGVITDITTKPTDKGLKITTLALEAKETYRDVTKILVYQVTVFPTTLEKAGRLEIGQEVFIQGKLSPRGYVDKNGINRVSLEVVGTVVKPLGQVDLKPANSDSGTRKRSDPVGDGAGLDVDSIPF